MSERTTPHVDLSQLLAESGLTEAELLEQLTAQSRRPTVSDHVESYLKVQTAGTRRGYATHLNRLVSGYGAVCDQTCEPCLGDGGDQPFTCRCTCRACVTSQIRIEPRSSDVVGTSIYTTEVVQQLAAVAKRLAIKRGIVHNRVRGTKGLPAKSADGIGAEENAMAALRSLFDSALSFTDGVNAAHAVKKPRRNTRERRPMQEFELLELCHLTSTSGNDTFLDELIVDFGIATGSRREGVHLLTVGQLHRDTQIIDLFDKYKRRQPAPVSRELIDRLIDHAVQRGGQVCNPDSDQYRPDSKVFYYQPTANGQVRPLTSRRFDNLSQRWQTSLPWAGDEQLGFHHLRHTMAAYLESHFGPQYKKRYLRHADGSATDGYGICTFDELARAMSDLLGFEHPLVHGINERRQETLDRFGISD